MKKRGKKKIIIILPVVLIIGVLIIPFAISTRTPVKYAVRLEDLYKYPNSILVKEAWHTGTGWEQVGDKSGKFPVDKVNDVHLIGNIPPVASIGGDHVNTFLCIVDYTGKYELKNSIEIFDEYEVIDWYPIYPVKRDTILPSWIYPKGYLSKYDKID